eukprot:Gb_03765 [translate_table: standard]
MTTNIGMHIQFIQVGIDNKLCSLCSTNELKAEGMDSMSLEQSCQLPRITPNGPLPLYDKIIQKHVNVYQVYECLHLVLMIYFLCYRLLNPLDEMYGVWMIALGGDSASKLPAVDIFVITPYPLKEPPIMTVNTVISALAMGHLPDKMACYVHLPSLSPLCMKLHTLPKNGYPFAGSTVLKQGHHSSISPTKLIMTILIGVSCKNGIYQEFRQAVQWHWIQFVEALDENVIVGERFVANYGWYKGVTQHMSFEKGFFVQYELLEERNAMFRDGIEYLIAGRGTVSITMPNREVKKFGNVLHIHVLTMNLLSIRKIIDTCMTIHFDLVDCMLKNRNGNLVASLVREGDLYK